MDQQIEQDHPQQPYYLVPLELGVHECDLCRSVFDDITKVIVKLQKVEERFRTAQACPSRHVDACLKCKHRFFFWLLKYRDIYLKFYALFQKLVFLSCYCSLRKQASSHAMNYLEIASNLITANPLSEQQIIAAPPAYLVTYANM